MSKRLSIVIAVFCAVVLLGSGTAAFFHITNQRNGAEALANSSTDEEIAELYAKKYSRGEEVSKAKEASNAVWLVESTELAALEDDEKDSVISDICSGFFDTVFFKPEYYSRGDAIIPASAIEAETKKLSAPADETASGDGDTKETSRSDENTDYSAVLGLFDKDFKVKAEDMKPLKEYISTIRDKEKKVVVSISMYSRNSAVRQACLLGADSILLQNIGLNDDAFTAARLKEVCEIIKQTSPELPVYADIPCGWDGFDAIDTSALDALYVAVGADVERDAVTLGDYSNYSFADCVEADIFDAWAVYWNGVAADCSLPLHIGYRADYSCSDIYNGRADTTFLQTVLSDNCSELKGRVYCSYSAFKKDLDSSMTAVEKYITEGVDLELACRPLRISGYSGDVVETDVSSTSFVVRCSNLFPLYIDDISYGVQETGERTVEAELVTGDNSFTVSQNGSTCVYNICYTAGATSPLITFIVPNTTVRIKGGDTLEVTIGAHVLATVTASIGGVTKTMVPSDANYSEYTAFSASFEMPAATDSEQDLGKVVLTASADGIADETYQGANVIIYAKGEEPTDEATTEEETSSAPSENGVTTQIDNSPYIETTELSTSSTATTHASGSQSGASSPSTTAAPLDKSVIGKTCIITSGFADTRPVTPLNNTYVPTYSSLTKGTLDTITDVVDCDDGDDYYQYYVLASGRRVMTENASVIESAQLTDNTVSVASSSSDSDTTINLSTTWRVPYNVVFTPQSYYRGYENKLYNVSSFTAQQIEITFYYTTKAGGNIDLSGSDVVGAYSWSTNPSARTSTLTLVLKQAGKFYGYSIGYNDDGTLCIKINGKVGVLSGSVIMIDPGHGGKDVGALGKSGTVYESSTNLAIAEKLKAYLVDQGAMVYMTRTDNTYFSLEQRRQKEMLINPDVFVSIHCNGSESPSSYGTSTFYFTPWSKTLAASINNRMVPLFDGTFYNGTKSSNLGDNFYPFSVCRGTNCPSVLVETAFITNDKDCDILLDSNNQESIAEAIGNGISDYLKAQAG